MRWAYPLALAGCVALAILCRLPFLNVPLTNDEGGYAYVARLWAAGAQLYGDAWVDRPQGLVVLFRLFDAVAPGTVGLRLCGAVYAGLSALLLAYLGARLYGPVVGVCAAALYAIFSSGPQIEGFIVNGELLATLPAVAAVALLLRARDAARPSAYLVLAGLAAGGALLVKQSAIDSPAIVLLFAPLAGASREFGPEGRGQGRPPKGLRRRVRPGLLPAVAALAGVLAALALSALWGAAMGWHQYLDAVVLDNLRYRSFDASANTLAGALTGIGWLWSEDAALIALAIAAVALLVGGAMGDGRRATEGDGGDGKDWGRRLSLSLLAGRPSRAGVSALANAVAATAGRLAAIARAGAPSTPNPSPIARRPPTSLFRLPPSVFRLWSWLPVPWLAVAALGVSLGGLYSRHYFVQLLPPLCLLAAAALVAGVRTARRLPWTALLAAVPLVLVALAARTDAPLYLNRSPVAVSQRLYGWPVYAHQAALVDFLRRRVPPGEPFFVAYAAAPLHYLTGRPSITRYLWRRPLGTVPGAYEAALRAVERGEPVCVIPVQPVAQPPGDARMRAALARHYTVAWRRPGLTVLCRADHGG